MRKDEQKPILGKIFSSPHKHWTRFNNVTQTMANSTLMRQFENCSARLTTRLSAIVSAYCRAIEENSSSATRRKRFPLLACQKLLCWNSSEKISWANKRNGTTRNSQRPRKERKTAKDEAGKLGMESRSSGLRFELFKAQGGICLYTGKALAETHLEDYEIDHTSRARSAGRMLRLITSLHSMT